MVKLVKVASLQVQTLLVVPWRDWVCFWVQSVSVVLHLVVGVVVLELVKSFPLSELPFLEQQPPLCRASHREFVALLWFWVFPLILNPGAPGFVF